MSHHIFYRSLAIAVPNGKFIIVTESGDNNVWECSGRRQRRARDWQSDVLISNRHNGFYTDLQTIESRLNEMETEGRERSKSSPYFQEGDDKRVLGWYSAISLRGKGCSQTSVKDMVSFYRKAIKSAKTIDEYNQFGVTFSIATNSRVQHGKDYQIRSTDDLVKYIAEFGQEFAEEYYTISTKVWDSSWTKLYPKKQRVAKPNVGDFVVLVNENFYMRGGVRGIKHTWMKKYARRMSESAAKKLVVKLQPYYNNVIFKIEKFNNE